MHEEPNDTIRIGFTRKGGITLMRGCCPRVSGGERSSPLSFSVRQMKSEKILSVFVDESGMFKYPDPDSRFYIVGLVLHDQDFDIQPYVRQLDENAAQLGLDSDVFTFHAGPLIRQEKDYAVLSRHFRGRIFDRMMSFARRVEYRYHCLDVDKQFITSTLQIATRLKKSLVDFLSAHRADFEGLAKVKVYYDCGQTPITNLLHQTFVSELPCPVEFAQGVRPENYKHFQVADLICTLHLVELKIENDEPLTLSEFKFFGAPRDFKRNVLRKIKPKEML